MWSIVAIVIECVAFLGILSILITRRTLVAFLTGFNTMALVTAVFVWKTGLSSRGLIAVMMVAIYLFRMNWVLLRWSTNTALSKLDGQTNIKGKLYIPLVLANTAGWAYCLPIYFAVSNRSSLDILDAIAIATYILGTAFHFGADYQKRQFKLNIGEEVRLLDTGFWALCRHPNYFGDFLIYVSFALLSHSIWGWVAPLLNLLQYIFDAIPKNERWASERYGKAWDKYKATTKAFVPHLF